MELELGLGLRDFYVQINLVFGLCYHVRVRLGLELGLGFELELGLRLRYFHLEINFEVGQLQCYLRRRFSSDDDFHGARVARPHVQVAERPRNLGSSSSLDDACLHRVAGLDQSHLHRVSV